MPPAATSHPRIAAIGTAVPAHCVRQADFPDLLARLGGLDASSQRRLRALSRRTRIEARQSCLSPDSGLLAALEGHARSGGTAAAPTTSQRMEAYEAEAFPLALAACRDALSQPGAPPADSVDHVLVASCTGFMAPGLDVLLTRELGLRADVGRTLVGFQGCQAGLTSLRLADALSRATPGATVLLCCVELCTLHVQSDPTDDNLLASALFGDGAAAALITSDTVPGTATGLGRVEACATHLLGDSLGDMTWRVGDTGFELHLSSYVPRLLGADVRSVLASRLAPSPAEAATLHWAVHPGGASILDQLEKALELPPDALRASRAVLARHGNMSSPTIWFVVRELFERGARGPTLALAFGPGLTIEAARLHLGP